MQTPWGRIAQACFILASIGHSVAGNYEASALWMIAVILVERLSE